VIDPVTARAPDDSNHSQRQRIKRHQSKCNKQARNDTLSQPADGAVATDDLIKYKKNDDVEEGLGDVSKREPSAKSSYCCATSTQRSQGKGPKQVHKIVEKTNYANN
jgi:hypothetical protein